MHKPTLYGLAAVASVVLLALSLTNRVPMAWTEVVAFVTGAWCIWLVVKENIFNWPIGLVNSTFSGIVFFDAELYADTVLQAIYFVLGIWGWYWWLHGGKDRTELKVERASLTHLITVAAIALVSTLLIRKLLIYYNGAAPFLDALLTSYSLAAQYLLTRKYIENWLVWIGLNSIYIPLLISRQLYLMAGLYGVFLVLAVMGFREWKRKLREQAAQLPAVS